MEKESIYDKIPSEYKGRFTDPDTGYECYYTNSNVPAGMKGNDTVSLGTTNFNGVVFTKWTKNPEAVAKATGEIKTASGYTSQPDPEGLTRIKLYDATETAKARNLFVSLLGPSIRFKHQSIGVREAGKEEISSDDNNQDEIIVFDRDSEKKMDVEGVTFNWLSNTDSQLGWHIKVIDRKTHRKIIFYTLVNFQELKSSVLTESDLEIL